MSYPTLTAKILQYLEVQFDDGTGVHSDQGVISIVWGDVAPIPKQIIIDTGNSSEFIAWHETHGGDPAKTLRRQAKNTLVGLRAEDLRHRAAFFALIGEFNRHADKLNEILDAVDAATSLADFKARVGAINDYPQRTNQQLINAVEAALDAGDVG